MGKGGIFESQFKAQGQTLGGKAPTQKPSANFGAKSADASSPEKTLADKPTQKIDFEGPETFRIKTDATSAPKQSVGGLEGDDTQRAIDAVNASIGSSENNKDKEIEEMDAFPEEDVELASKLIFEGYAEKKYELPHLKLTVTICSMRAEEYDIVDEMIYRFVKKHENADSQVDIPRNLVVNQTRFYTLALCFAGENDNDIATEAVYKLSTVKRAVTKMLRLQFDGDLENLKSLRDQVFDAIEKRSVMLRMKSPMLLDFVQECKADFDKRMFGIMNRKNLIPKF